MASMSAPVNSKKRSPRAKSQLGRPQISRWNESSSWYSDIQCRQQKFVTPEIRAKQRKRAERTKRLGKRKKKAKMYQKCAKISKNAWAQGMHRQHISAPSHRVRSAEISNDQMRQMQRVYKSRNLDDSDEEEELECAVAKMEQIQQLDVVQVTENQQDILLRDLRIEPKEDSEIEAKFKLYEEFLKTVESSRKATFDFWAECKEEFTKTAGQGNAVKQVEANLKNLDCEENMAIQWSEFRWFVYDMMVKADSNNVIIEGMMKNIETKIELLQQEDNDCPFCLDPLKEKDDVHTLGCCHQACSECWLHWQNLKGKAAFCPLCRQEDFLSSMV